VQNRNQKSRLKKLETISAPATGALPKIQLASTSSKKTVFLKDSFSATSTLPYLNKPDHKQFCTDSKIMVY
jgi:hypothetical protein